MTKSVQEKNRIKEIKRCESLGIKIANELLNVKISYINPYRSYRRNIRNCFLKPNFLKEHTFPFLKENIKSILFDIANNLKIYELKVQVLIESSSKIKALNHKKLNLYMMLRLTDHKNRNIGNIIIKDFDVDNESIENDIFDNVFVNSKSIGCFVNNKKSNRLNEIMHIKNMLEYFNINKGKISIVLNNEYIYKNKEIINLIHNFQENIKIYDLTKMLQKRRKTRIFIFVSNSIKYVLSTTIYLVLS